MSRRPARSPRRPRSSPARERRHTSPHRRRRRQPAPHPAGADGLDRAFDLVRHALTVAGVVGVAYFANRSIAALAGETTAAEIAFRFLANVRLSEALAWLFGASGVGFGYLQRGMRQKARRAAEEDLRRPAEPAEGRPTVEPR